MKKAKKGFAPVLALLALFIGVSLVAGIVFINSGVQKQSSQPDLNIRQKENTNSSDTSKKQRGNSLKIDEPPVYGESETFDITGKIKEIPAIAGLLSGEAPLGAHYYEAGVYSSGMYTGYKRIIVTKEPTGPGDPRNNVLLTKDNLNFIFEVDL